MSIYTDGAPTGFVLRKVNPAEDLQKALDELWCTVWETKGQIFYRDDGSMWVDDRQVRDADLNVELAGCTEGFGVFSNQWQLLGTFRANDKADKALRDAKVSIAVDVELDHEDPVGPGVKVTKHTL